MTSMDVNECPHGAQSPRYCAICRRSAPVLAEPVKPYAQTSGWSGSQTSKSRALHFDNSGKTRSRQNKILAYLYEAGEHGATWKEISDMSGMHHGTATGALSNLHMKEKISRLADTRNRCEIYVLNEYVNGRPTNPHKSNTPKKITGQHVETCLAMIRSAMATNGMMYATIEEIDFMLRDAHFTQKMKDTP